MRFLIGLLLTPVAGTIGTALVFALYAFFATQHDVMLQQSLAYVPVAIALGSLLAAPVTMVALPVADIYRPLDPLRGAAVGLIAGALCAGLSAFLSSIFGLSATAFASITITLALMGGFSGAVCGALFGLARLYQRAAAGPSL